MTQENQTFSCPDGDLSRLANDAAGLCRATRQLLTPRRRRGAVASELKKIILERLPAAEQRNIPLVLDCPKDLCLYAYWELLNEAVSGLLYEVLKNTQSGREIMLKAFRCEENCVIHIADDMMTSLSADLILPPFARISPFHHSCRKQKASVAREAIELHGGEIVTRRIAPAGSIAILVLPIAV